MILSLPFFITALLYATVGFGGGSTYNALLVLAEIDYRILPFIALICNLIVVSGGTYKFYRAGHIDFKRIAPWVITSVPASWLGGYLNISETTFVGVLGFSLLVAGFRMLWSENVKHSICIHQYPFLPPLIGAILGLLAGIVGIGGGIFLAPILYALRWGSAKEIAGMCSIFILVNSLAGLVGQTIKLSDGELLSHTLTYYWMLFPAVLVGGQIGSHMGTKVLNLKIIRLMTAVLILYVSVSLIWRWLEMLA